MSATLHVHVLVSSENGRDRRQLVRHTWMDFFFRWKIGILHKLTIYYWRMQHL